MNKQLSLTSSFNDDFNEKHWIKTLYCDRKMTMGEIANKYSLDRNRIAKVLGKQGIKKRSNLEVKELHRERNSPDLSDDINWLIEQYWGFNLTAADMGELAGCGKDKILHQMHKFEVPTTYGLRRKTLPFKTRVEVEPELLTSLYWGNQLSFTKIAKLLIYPETVTKRLFKKYKIPTRSPKEKGNMHRNIFQIKKEDLEQLYLIKLCSMREIAEAHHTSTCTIGRWLDRYKIPKRSMKQISQLIADQLDKPYNDKNLLTELYWGFDLSTMEIAKKYNITQGTIISLLRKHNILNKTHCNMYVERDGQGNKQCHTCWEWREEFEFRKSNIMNDNLSRTCFYCECKDAAKHRKHKFALTPEKFKELISGNCYYCGKKPDRSNGVDRLDSSKGYIKGNVVSCCTRCNRAKNNISLKEFATEVVTRYAWAKEYLKQHP